ncbi:hypothetical protein F9856_01105 [Streptococcus suis]|uniref:hypothetical protein n=1 Tax=Streptococcus suis TaxID=1307 RepID=UPI000CF46AA3|nr:hypothetical protein [Streptococcus suis]MBL1124770.1 hypothetical protein [Streptococcus suis]HEL1585037.1 hypothetical protein [Streptococcus suis]HEL1603613.1 hypothetical protein [Streptococcus suis]
MKTKKAYWLTLLLVAVVLFLLGLNTGVYAFNLLAIGISFLVYRNGYDVLFKEYDDSQKEKRETAEKIYAALREGKKKGE